MQQLNELLKKIPSQHQIPRLSGARLSSFYDDFYLKERPVILEGALLGWECLRRWTPEALQRAMAQATHTFHYEEERTLQMKVHDYLNIAFNKRAEDHPEAFPEVPSPTERLPYLRHFGPLQGIEADYRIESLFPRPEEIRFISYLFCGVPSTKTNCHYDWSHNFVGVVKGLKHVTLLPPKAEQHMRVSDELRAKMARGSCDYFEDPAGLRLRLEELSDDALMMHQHPVLQGCPALYYAPLQEGDLVFFPAYWYHYFHNLESCLSVTTQTARYSAEAA